MTVPELANTGPVQVINQDLNLPGNSLNFLVGACSKNDDCSSSGANSTCCPASSPKAGQCAQTLFDFVHPANSCYANILVSEFDWKFNSGVNCVGLSQADCLAKLAWCGWDATLQACTACASNSSQTACNGIGTDACCWDGSSCIGKGTKTKNSDGTCGVGSDCASHGDADTCKNDGTCCWGGNTTKCTSTALYDRDNSGACLASSCGSVAKNGAACPVGGTCPNSPGSCSNYAGGNIPLGLCSGFGCNVLSECSGNK